MKQLNATPEKEQTDARKLFFLRLGLGFLLSSLIAGFGAASYVALRNIEIKNFEDQYDSSAAQIAKTIYNSLEDKYTAGSMANHIYGYAIQNGYVGTMPNVTLPGFEDIFGDLIKLASLRGCDFDPLVTTDNRKAWEAYAAENVGLLEGPDALWNRSASGYTGWLVSDGIYNKTKAGFAYDMGYNEWAERPEWLFPVWQIAPIEEEHYAVMHNPYSMNKKRAQLYDKMFNTGDVSAFFLWLCALRLLCITDL
jgi:hypothetical protein